jgi:hypothetical protein
MSLTEKAIHKGAIFEQYQGKHLAVLRKRGRAIPIATFIGTTKDEAAELFLKFVEKSWKHSPERKKATSQQETATVGSLTRLQKLPASTTST